MHDTCTNPNSSLHSNPTFDSTDSWESYDGMNWTLLSAQTSLGARAWFTMAVMHGSDPKKVGIIYLNDLKTLCNFAFCAFVRYLNAILKKSPHISDR
jgi:hypothetical protein